jgi:hypothetical protein
MKLDHFIMLTVVLCYTTLTSKCQFIKNPHKSRRAKLHDPHRNEFLRQASNETHIFEVVFRENAISGTHLLATSNFAYRYLTLNWIVSLARQNLTQFVILCLDEETLLFLASRNYANHVALIPPVWY